MGNAHLMGKRVRVTFNTKTWPVPYGTYTYQGYDDGGHWVLRDDGFQRYLLNIDVLGIEAVAEEE